MEFDKIKYVIIPKSEINKINFEQVLENSEYTCRYSIDGMQTFVKYKGKMPSSIKSIENKSKEYTHHEFINLLSKDIWTKYIYFN